MKVCRVKPSVSICFDCKVIDPDWGLVCDCENCPKEINNYAMVLIDGKVRRVPLKDNYDIREVQFYGKSGET